MSQSRPTDHEIEVYTTEFALTGDKSKSFRKAFPKSTAGIEGTAVSASRFHKIARVPLTIAKKRTEIAKNDKKNFDISYEAQVQRCLDIYSAGLSEVEKQGVKVSQNLSASQAAVNEINKMAGHNDRSTLAAVKFKFDASKPYTQQCIDIVEAASQGHISADVANIFIAAIKSCIDIQEATELKGRIEELEALVGI